MKHLAKRIMGGATALAVLAFILGAVAASDTGTAQAFSHGHLNRMRVVKSALDADDRFAHGVQLIEV